MDGSFLAILVTSLFLCSQANGFCGSRSLHTSLVRSAVRAGEWLRNNHDGNGTYHEGHVSAFVFHSLRMIGHSVDKGADHMNAEITTRGLGSIPGGRIGLYIHGVLAACRDPKRFYNFNLVRALTTKLKKFPQPGFDDYFKYSLAVMALCSSGRTALPYVDKIIERMSSRLRDEYVDTLAYQVMALSCVRNRGEGMVVEKVQNWIEVGSQELLRRKGNESHIHDNEVSTALASQALLAANVKKWKSCKTLRWLQARQNPDGSFSSLMSTVYLIPSLIGALPYEVGDIPCHRTGTIDEPVFQLDHFFCETTKVMYEQFDNCPSLKDITLRSRSSVMHGKRNLGRGTYFHLKGLHRAVQGVPSPPDPAWKLEKKAAKVLHTDHDVNVF